MVQKLVSWGMAGIFLLAWMAVGSHAFFANADGGYSTGYLLVTALTIALVRS